MYAHVALFALGKRNLGSLTSNGYNVWFNRKRWNMVERNVLILDSPI